MFTKSLGQSSEPPLEGAPAGQTSFLLQQIPHHAHLLCGLFEHHQKFVHFMQVSYDHDHKRLDKQFLGVEVGSSARAIRGGGGGVGMRSTRRSSCTRTLSWVIMSEPPRRVYMDTHHPRRFTVSGQLLGPSLFMTRPHLVSNHLAQRFTR